MQGWIQEMESEADALQQCGFIQQLGCPPTGDTGLYRSSCRFSLSRFDPGLFAAARIQRPPEIVRSVQKRQAEYLAGRYLAAGIFAGMFPQGSEVPQVAIGNHRNPLWPAGIVGSISHCGEEAVCVLARDTEYQSLGVDLENWMTPSVCAEISPSVLVDDEAALLIRRGMSREQAVTLIFSAKESLFKALYPRVGEYFGFECARVISADSPAGTLVLALQPAFADRHGLEQRYTCACTRTRETVETFIAVRAA